MIVELQEVERNCSISVFFIMHFTSAQSTIYYGIIAKQLMRITILGGFDLMANPY